MSRPETYARHTLPPLTTGSLLVAKLDSGEKPIMAFGIVPIAAIEDENI